MALSSMTGFARGQGQSGPYAWSWELKSVNAKGLDVRLRLPVGWDGVEAPARAKASDLLNRGTVYATLSVERQGMPPTVRVNENVLEAVLGVAKSWPPGSTPVHRPWKVSSLSKACSRSASRRRTSRSAQRRKQRSSPASNAP